MFLLIVASLALLVYCVLDLVTTPPSAVRTLPKPVWFVVVLAPVLGPATWFLFGRPPRGATRRNPTRPAAAPRPPDDDEDFLRDLRRRADEQRRRASDPRDDTV